MASIGIEILVGAVELSYRITPGGGQPQDIRYRVPLTYTPCNYGGERPWFICPGKGCGRRVAKLYLHGTYFLCRHCHDLIYESQQNLKDEDMSLPARFDQSTAYLLISIKRLALSPYRDRLSGRRSGKLVQDDVSIRYGQ